RGVGSERPRRWCGERPAAGAARAAAVRPRRGRRSRRAAQAPAGRRAPGVADRVGHPRRSVAPVTAIDLNADLGESFGRWTLGDDEAMLDVVTSANVACG